MCIFEQPGEQGTFAEHRVSPSPPRTPGCSCYSVERWFSLVSLLVVEETHKCDLPTCWWYIYIARMGKASLITWSFISNFLFWNSCVGQLMKPIATKSLIMKKKRKAEPRIAH